jgi:hypothetical protein
VSLGDHLFEPSLVIRGKSGQCAEAECRPEDRFMSKTGAELAVSLLLPFGSTCLIVVVLTHVAEALHIFSSMGWGLPDSAGHYLDLVCAVLGSVLLSLGFLVKSLSRRRSHRRD